MSFLLNGTKFLFQSEIAIFASFHTLSWLLKKKKKKIFKALKKTIGISKRSEMIDLFKIFYYWILMLPLQHLVRIIDCFLVEGHKVLIRVAISLLCLWYKNTYKMAKKGRASKRQSIKKQTIRQVNEQICTLSRNCPVPVESLLRMSFSIRGLTRSTINSRQRLYEEKYRSEVLKMRMNSRSFTRAEHLFTEVFTSEIVSTEIGGELMTSLPERCRLETPTLLFRLSQDGASFVQLWTRIDAAERSLLLIRATTGAIFGAYVSSSWSERNDQSERSRSKYFGTGESFVWKISDGKLMVYRWVDNSMHEDSLIQIPQMFMAAGNKFLIIGSGGGDAIYICDELSRGRTYPSETFNSPELAPGNDFEIDELEVFEVNPIDESLR